MDATLFFYIRHLHTQMFSHMVVRVYSQHISRWRNLRHVDPHNLTDVETINEA